MGPRQVGKVMFERGVGSRLRIHVTRKGSGGGT